MLTVPAYPVEISSPKVTIAVTGCTGYVAGSIVQRLLVLGHTVHGTCRDPKKAEALKALPGGQERLKLFTSDLMKSGSFDEAFTGCQYVVHCASPYTTNCPKHLAKERIITPAIQGTENVISSVNKIPTIKRVVLTSSCAAVYGNPTERGAGHVFDEEDWALAPTETVLPYFYSKREAEKRAWALAEQQSRWDLIVINPPGIFGPPVTDRADGTSLDIIKQIMTGRASPACPDLGLGWVDVRDVAAAHSLALFTPTAKGRYVCSAGSTRFAELARTVAELFPTRVTPPSLTVPKWLLWLVGPLAGVPRDMVNNSVGLPGPAFSSEKIKKELGLTFLDFSTMLQDQVRTMTDLKLIS